jgi:ubiquinone/menaquinone biosynthesis C-methylase UbiE
MAEMSRFEKNFCTGRMYAAFARRFIVPWALDRFHPTGEALEIGSGSGAMAAQLLHEFPDLRIIATDYDPELVAVSAQSLEPFGQRATVNRADAAALPFADDRFDVVLSFAMFHHVPDWERAVGEAMRVLRPGGTLVGYDLSRLRQLETELRRLPARDLRTRRFLGGLFLRFLVVK